ncbi:hypothetical protein [Herminiimonas sp. CN]|uniref:hypothetical protein n=1 Tax=Herminiimonas sp. CN TaxID=1349818 RepID=UPI00047322CF|nr:hypothetical protein [Herminiimonas sp. CN]
MTLFTRGKHDTCAAAMQGARAWLEGRGIHYLYLPPHQLKIGPLNFWPGTGTITVDGEGGRRSEKGLEGLKGILSADCEEGSGVAAAASRSSAGAVFRLMK